MRPILYDENESDFTSQGLGGLADAVSCVVTEERNGLFELEMTYPVGGTHYADIAVSRIVKAEPNPGGSPQLFRIYAITKPIGGIVTIAAEHISYQLSYIPVGPFVGTTAQETLTRMGQNAMTDCPFTFWTDKQTVAAYKQTVPDNIRQRLGGVSGSVLDVYGGEYEFDNYTVKLHNHRGMDRGVTLRYGKNLTDLEQEENIASTYTSIVGFWQSDEEEVHTAVIDSESAGNFPYKRVKVVDFSSDYEEKPSLDKLTERATAYLKANDFGVPKVSLKVSFIALDQTEEYKGIAPLERVYLCDTVKVQFERLGVRATAKVIKTVYDVLKGRYTSIELGKSRADLAQRLASQEREIQEQAEDTLSEMEKAISRATEMITGEKGGYIVDRFNANGERYEILIMDTNDINTARKVWRWNLSGWGYSSTGINGPYKLAATQDGAIVADFITAGTMTANLIRAGVLQDIKGYNYWNLQTGEFRLVSTATIEGKSIATEDYAANAAGTAEANAKSYASTTAASVASTLDASFTQEKVFNRLTNNGAVQGIILANGQLYVNATYINTGTLSAGLVKAGILSDGQGKNYWNMETGEFRLAAGAKVGGGNIASVDDAASAATAAAGAAITNYDGTLNQTAIFNKLTDNGSVQGIILNDGQLYVNASYISTGILADAGQNTVFNLSTGALKAKKLSVDSENFDLTESGDMTCKNANLTGKVTSTSGSAKAVLDSAKLQFNNGSEDLGRVQMYGTGIEMKYGGDFDDGGYFGAGSTSATLGYSQPFATSDLYIDVNGQRIWLEGATDVNGELTVRDRLKLQSTLVNQYGNSGASGHFYDRDGNTIEVEDGLIVSGLII